MEKKVVLTLTGQDRVGIVEAVTEIFVKYGGNVEASRMARLGGEFAMLALISLGEGELTTLEADLGNLRSAGFQIMLLPTSDDHAHKYAGWLPYQIEVLGADHEGIIHGLALHLAQQGINIESMETATVPAPMSGAPLFTMQAAVLVPPSLPYHQWSDTLEEIGDRMNVSVKVAMIR